VKLKKNYGKKSATEI